MPVTRTDADGGNLNQHRTAHGANEIDFRSATVPPRFSHRCQQDLQQQASGAQQKPCRPHTARSSRTERLAAGGAEASGAGSPGGHARLWRAGSPHADGSACAKRAATTPARPGAVSCRDVGRFRDGPRLGFAARIAARTRAQATQSDASVEAATSGPLRIPEFRRGPDPNACRSRHWCQPARRRGRRRGARRRYHQATPADVLSVSRCIASPTRATRTRTPAHWKPHPHLASASCIHILHLHSYLASALARARRTRESPLEWSAIEGSLTFAPTEYNN